MEVLRKAEEENKRLATNSGLEDDQVSRLEDQNNNLRAGLVNIENSVESILLETRPKKGDLKQLLSQIKRLQVINTSKE